MSDPANFYARLASAIKGEEIGERIYEREWLDKIKESEQLEKIVNGEIPWPTHQSHWSRCTMLSVECKVCGRVRDYEGHWLDNTCYDKLP